MELEAVGDMKILDVPPKYGLKIPLNHVYPLQSKQIVTPKPKQILEMMPLSARYLKYFIAKKLHKKRPIMDYINMVSAQRMYGCPIGGIGGGTIGRGYKGEFCRFQLYPGIYEYTVVPECQFIVNIRSAKKETIFQSVLSTYEKPKKAPQTWEWNLNGGDCEYTGLYPRAWTTYDLSKYGVKLVCRQISPVIPHNYKDSSLPCAVFVFTVENVSDEHRDVSITFTWTEVLGGRNKKKHIAKLDLERYSEEYTCGVTLEQKIGDTPCTFTIAKKKQENETIHDGYCLFNAAKTSSLVWETLQSYGRLQPAPAPAPAPAVGEGEGDRKDKPTKVYKCDSMGLSSVISLGPKEVGSTEFCLAWDMPVIKYKKEKKVHKRFYTRYFGSDGIAGAAIAAYALRNYPAWERQLHDWQDNILTNSNIPDWLKGALMNELYFIADGGTIWFDVRDEYPDTDPRHEFGLFGYLEGHEYRMYNTYDVHFYASFALAQLWPNLQVVLQYMFRDAIGVEIDKCRQSLYDGKSVKFKIKDSVPHDLGDPDDIPFLHINAYNIHDVSEWRDLDLKFVLQVWRDLRLLRAHAAPFGNQRYRSMAYIDDIREGTELDLYVRATGQSDGEREMEDGEVVEGEGEGTQPPTPPVRAPRAANDILDLLYRNNGTEEEEDEKHEPKEETAAVWDSRMYLLDMYSACTALVRRALKWDKDGDGLIENGGFPDQTYDAWVMSGPSAYCGSLWVASLTAVCEMAHELGHLEDEKEFSELLERARSAFEEKLWTGNFYRFDTRPANSNVVMADQLVGQWFVRASGCRRAVFPSERVSRALRCVYAHNVRGFNGGRMGAVNGYVSGARGRVDTSALQSMEVWSGVTYGLAALMIYEGMHEEAFATAGGLHKTLKDMGLSYETPEALYENGNHRSIAYMRPLAIWAMYQAILAVPSSPTPIANGHCKETSKL